MIHLNLVLVAIAMVSQMDRTWRAKTSRKIAKKRKELLMRQLVAAGKVDDKSISMN